MFEEKEPISEFPCFLTVKDESLAVCSEDHYKYLNEFADKLYQEIYGYISQPDFDYFCSTHPQEFNCFCVALAMDDWCARHEFNLDA